MPATAAQMNRAQFLPKIDVLPGSIQVRLVRCSKPGCRCARGGLHGPYFRRVWREVGMTRARYVPLAQLDHTRQAVAAWRQRYPSGRALRREMRTLRRLLEEDVDGC